MTFFIPESGTDISVEMDQGQGSIDLSLNGPYSKSQDCEIHGEEMNMTPSMTSSGYFPNGHVMTHKPYYPSPEIPINRTNNGHLDISENDCLDLSRTGPYSSNGVNILHCSGGVSIDLSRHQNGITNNGLLDLRQNGNLLQLPRIKLEPGLGIGLYCVSVCVGVMAAMHCTKITLVVIANSIPLKFQTPLQK